MSQPNTAKFILRLLDSFKKNEDKIAIVDQNGQRQTTYKELFTMACRVVGYLQQKNYPPHSFIGICLPSSMEYVAAQLGIWLSGNVIVPMGDSYPQDRIDYIMGHCEASLLINEVIFKAIANEAPKEIVNLPEEDDINALFYTSGSTGHPKGVIHTFRSLNFSVAFDLELMRAINPLTFGYTSPLYFIACRFYLSVLLLGGKIDLISTNVINDIRLMEDYIEHHKLTAIFLTPSLLQFFHCQASCLQMILTGSERLAGIGPHGYRLFNIYGQTETFGPLLSFEVEKQYDNTPIGKPYSTVEMLIVDKQGNKVKPGEIGELCLKGDFTLGYFKDEKQTSHLFRGGLLHTDDLVRELPDGNIIFVNRQDWMVKINGQRVEPGEVEVVIKQIDGIKNAIVKGFTTKDRQFLCAYYIANGNVSEDTIREYLRSKLPAYMVPVYFVRMKSFPLLPNGKTDRKSLLAPTVQAEGGSRPPYAEPTDPVEHQLCNAFEKTLSIDCVGIDDDFFELGGDSIRIMEVQTLCPELKLSSRMIYENRTPRKIAEACKHTKQVSYEIQKDYPLSQTQLGIYVECMSQQGKALYNNAMLFKLADNIDTDRLARAFEAVVQAHPYIKTRLYVDEEGHPHQRRNDEELYHQSIEHVNETDFAKLKPQLEQPFQLLSDQLFRIRIIKTDENVYLFIDFHHIIFDGTSLNVLFADLNKAYRGESIEREIFSGFEIAQEEEFLRQTDAYSDAKEWNLRMFGDMEITSLPLSDKSEQDITFGRQELDLGLEESELKHVCSLLNVTPNIFTISAFGYLLGYYNYSNESLFATIYHGRHDLKTNHTIAMMVKTLPVHIKWNEKTTLSELLQATKELMQGSMANDLFSFAEMKAANNFINSEVIFAYQADLDSTDVIGNGSYTQLPLMNNATGESLTFEISRHGKSLTLCTEYHSNAYSDAFIRRMMLSYIHLIKAFATVNHGDALLSHLPLLSQEDSQALLAVGTGAPSNVDSSDTFVKMFHRQVERTPDAIAIVDKYSSITYSELDKQSDTLAAALIKAGVINDSVVALMLPRRKEFLVAVIAVFKAGGAYLSIDPDYPQARIDFMLNDLGVKYVITSEAMAKRRNLSTKDRKGCTILLDHFDFSVNVPSIDYSRPHSLAYIIYTSGTSGNPKGVMCEHHSLCAMLTWLIQMEGLKEGDRCALQSSFNFDASLPDMFGPLVCGAQVHVISSSFRYELGSLSHYLFNKKITGMTLSTQVGMELLESYDLTLNYLFLGGESLHVSRKTPVRVINGYGPTEFTVCSSYHIVDPNQTYDRIPIGRPVPGSKSVVIGLEGKLVPWGALGELCLVGPQLARGYWQREQQNKEKFVDCPFFPGERMYRTGDLVQWNQDGELMFHGRIDNQVKLNGFRIELGEIENCINEYLGIQTSAVILSKYNNLQILVGFYVADNEIDSETLSHHLSSKMPAYMVPQKLIQLDAMPKTPNGKIDHRKLQEYVNDLPVVTGTIEAPFNQREQILLDLIKKLLGIDNFGVTDDLTQLGLSSLDAIKLSSLAEKRGLKLMVNDILNNKTIRNIANQELSFGRWLNKYRPDKPIVIAIQGFSPHQVHNYFETLRERFSVFIFASIDDYFDQEYRNLTKSGVIAKYVQMLHDMLPSNAVPYAFTGHCLGGELAYRCAAQWQAETGQSPKVFVLNTPLRTDDEVRQMMPSQSMIEQMPPERQQKLFDWEKQQKRVISFLDGRPMPSFKGEVVFFRAMHPFLAVNKLTLDIDAFNRQVEIYLQRWKELQPQMKIIHIPSDHFKMLEPEYSRLYMKEL